jgi:5-methylcytosine-specific restriction endonuclease McrA
MSTHSLRHLGDGALVHATRELAARERLTTAELLAHLAEVDARRLYVPAGYPSMYAWCVGELRFSEDEAYLRIRVARAAHQHPAIFPMLADGRLNLSTVRLLTPCLTTGNAPELLEACAGRSRAKVERVVAERFPRPDVPDLVMALGPGPAAGRELVPEPVHLPRGAGSDPALGTDGALTLAVAGGSLVPERVPDAGLRPAPGRVRSRVAALSAGRHALQCTIDQPTHDLLRRAQSLLGHTVPSGDLGPVLHRALAALVAQLEKRRFGATERPRACRRRGDADPRAIPAAVRRRVWERDRGRCTFVGDGGHRCESRHAIEFDHIQPIARGGESTPGNLRLRCRAHNHHEAERAYGRDFMAHQRDEAWRVREAERQRREAARCERDAARERERAAREVERRERAAASARIEELVPALRNLGLSVTDARLAAARAVGLPPDTPLERRLHAVLRTLAPRGTERVAFKPATAGASSSG